MNATLFTFDAAQWGGVAFGAFIAMLAYCTAYLMETQQFRLGTLDLTGPESNRLRRPLLIVTALVSLALFFFSLVVSIGLQVLPHRPMPVELERRYFTEVQHKDAGLLASQRIVAAKVRVLAYDGFSHARVFFNHQRVFESSVHCRFVNQCKTATQAEPSDSTALVCLPFQCTTNTNAKVERYFPVLLPLGWSERSRDYAKVCSEVETLKEIRTCEKCQWNDGCAAGRRVNWQIGIESAPNELPFERDLMTLLRSGDNVVEVTAENSGVGRCALKVELVVQTEDGKTHPHTFEINGPLKSSVSQLGPRYGVEPSREPFTTCDRQRMKLALRLDKGSR
jgi:hypothetical protein